MKLSVLLTIVALALSACSHPALDGRLLPEEAATYERGNYMDKLQRLPGEIFIRYQSLLRDKIDVADSTRYVECYRHRTVGTRDIVTLCTGTEHSWYENPRLKCEPSRRAYGARHDAVYWCQSMTSSYPRRDHRNRRN